MGDGVPLGPLAISAATNATPIVITIPAHGVPVGDVTTVTVTGVIGNTGANGTWVAEAVTATTLKLRNSVGNGTYTSGGVATRQSTYTHIAEVVNITPIGMVFTMVDVSSHDSAAGGWGSAIPTFKSGTDMRLDLNLVPAHPTHNLSTGLIGLALGRENRPWLVVFPDAGKTTVAFRGWVSDHGIQTPVDGALKANPVISIDAEMVWTYS